jgi:phosphatidylserine synthase
MRRDLVCSAILLCIAALYYLAATGIQQSTLEDEIGPRGLPTVLAALLAMVASSSACARWSRRRQAGE